MFYYTVYENELNEKGESTVSCHIFKELTFRNYNADLIEHSTPVKHKYKITPLDCMNEYYNSRGLHLMYNVLGSCDNMTKFRPIIYYGYKNPKFQFSLITCKITLILRGEDNLDEYPPRSYGIKKPDIVYSDGSMTDGIKHYGAVMTDFMRTLVESTDDTEEESSGNENNKDYSNVIMFV